MNYHEYQELFDKVLETENPSHPYNGGAYLGYTKLNRSRMRRWDKQLELDPALSERLQQIQTPQHWIIITEPWCGDAAHIVPFLVRMAAQNSLITYDIRLRDSEPALIGAYLTNGAKSIPKLVVRDEHQADIFSWGPRPKEAQELMHELKTTNADAEAIKTALQHWYNEDKGVSLSSELAAFY